MRLFRDTQEAEPQPVVDGSLAACTETAATERSRSPIDGRPGTAFAPALGSAPFTGTLTLPALEPRSPGSVQGQPYGFALSLVGYRLDLNAVVKITAGATISVSDFKRTVRLPALDLMTLDLPGFALGAHEGTEDTYEWQDGLRAYENRPAAPAAGKLRPTGRILTKPAQSVKPAKPAKPVK